ncbi:MAG: TonB-dependent receptor plug domain-containing protein, partial [Erythrobacter sp.]
MRFNKGSLLAGTIMASAMFAAPAAAQVTQDSEVDPAIQSGADQETDADNFITVTGSRIQQRNVETAAPIAVVEAEEFQLTGTVNVENVLNALPQVVPGFGSASNNPGNGTATVDLRGLGDTRTLVLVNGRRWVSFDPTQTVDLNTIPNFLIETVDTVTGGASAVYGSDALAGVVNFNLRQVEGVEFGGQYSLTERGDAARYQLYGAIGTSFDDGRGNATVFAEYFNRESLFQGDRGFSTFALSELPAIFGPPLQQGGSSTLPQGVLRYLGGAQGDATLPAGTDFGAAGESGFGTGVNFAGQPGVISPTIGDPYNYAPVNYLQIPQERYLMGGFADYEFTDGHTAYTEVTFVNNRVAQELAATPVTGTFSVDLDTVQPFLDAASFAQLQAIDAEETAVNTGAGAMDDPGVVDFFVQRRTIETGPRNTLDERNAFRVLAGVRGEITQDLNYDLYYMYARTRNANIQDGNISRSAFQAGLDGTGATPINIFGGGTLTPEMVDAISIRAQNGDISTLEVASGVVSGFLGNLGFGASDIGFAVGAEYRRVAAQFIPDTALSSGDVIGFNAGEPTAGNYDVKEVFAEVVVPVYETDNG